MVIHKYVPFGYIITEKEDFVCKYLDQTPGHIERPLQAPIGDGKEL